MTTQCLNEEKILLRLAVNCLTKDHIHICFLIIQIIIVEKLVQTELVDIFHVLLIRGIITLDNCTIDHCENDLWCSRE